MYFLQSDSEIEDSLEPSVPKSSKKKKQSKPASKAQSPKMKVKKATDPPSDHEAESTASPSPSPKKRKKRKSVEVPVNGLDAEDGESAKRRRIDTDLSGDVSAEPTDNLPRAVIKLMKKYEKKHGDDAVKVLTTQETKDLKDKLRKNYKAFFKEHPYPRAAMLVHVAALEGKEREDAETFIADNKLYKMLGKGIPHDPITIYRTLEKCYPVRNTRREEPFSEVFTLNTPSSRTTEPPTLHQVLRTKDIDSAHGLLKDTYTLAECIWLYRATLKQTQSDLWHRHRFGRITASRMHRIYNFMSSPDTPGSVTRLAGVVRDALRLLRPSACGGSWGERHEASGVADYIKDQSPTHKQLKVTPCGLWVNPEYPHLGASSDGYVTCACCPPRLLEVKCPQLARPEDAPFLDVSDGPPRLVRSHRYHTQAQAQMGVMGTRRLDLVVWTPARVLIVPVLWDAELWDQIKEACCGFFDRHVLPVFCADRTVAQIVESLDRHRRSPKSLRRTPRRKR